MKEGTNLYVPPVSHAGGGSSQASLNPQASEFIPSGTSGSAGRAAATATATARRAPPSHQDCRLDAPAPSSAKLLKKRSTAGDNTSLQHGRPGRREGSSENGDMHVLHGAAVNQSATAVTMRALGTNTRARSSTSARPDSSSNASLGADASAALEKPERRRGGRCLLYTSPSPRDRG